MPDPIRLRPKNDHGEVVLGVAMSSKALEFLVALRSTGLWGRDVEEVCQRMIYDYLQRMIASGELGDQDA